VLSHGFVVTAAVAVQGKIMVHSVFINEDRWEEHFVQQVLDFTVMKLSSVVQHSTWWKFYLLFVV
jgi:hypothetical protein